MKIQVWDWRAGGQLLEGSDPKHGEVFEGTVADAFRVAQEFFERGLNVMVKRCGGRNVGTRKKPVIEPESILVAVDNYHFQQR